MKRKVILNLSSIFLLILVLATIQAEAAVISVDSNGKGNYSSIQEAVDNAQEGDTIFVNPGVYQENIKVEKKVSILANSSSENPGIRVYVLGAVSDEDVFHVKSNNVTISGFFISGGPSAGERYEVGIYLEGAKNCSLSGNVLVMNDVGITLAGAQGNNLVNNLVSMGAQGILLEGSEDNTLLNNLVITNDQGIVLTNSANNTLLSNTASSNSKGISLEMSNMNNLMSSKISKNEYGIFVLKAESNFISNNSLYLNNIGIYFNESSNNVAYLNEFSNFYNAVDEGTNIWNSSSKGNYWSNYIGEDADGNGIGDTSYVINEKRGIKDFLPLMNRISSYTDSEEESDTGGNETV